MVAAEKLVSNPTDRRGHVWGALALALGVMTVALCWTPLAILVGVIAAVPGVVGFAHRDWPRTGRARALLGLFLAVTGTWAAVLIVAWTGR